MNDKQKIKLSGEQQIAIILKSGCGSWKTLEENTKKRVWGRPEDLKIIKSVRELERKHKIRFVYDQFEPMMNKEIRFIERTPQKMV